MISKKEALTYNSQFNVAGTGTYYTATGNNPNRSHGAVVANIHTKHGKGFWSHIQIHEDDFIRFKLFKGSLLPRLLYKLKLKEPRDEDGVHSEWRYIRNQENANAKLEAALGKIFLKIDEDIYEWTAKKLEGADHRKFIKGIAKTDPENLKMIAGLKDLHDGMEAPLEDSQLLSGGTTKTVTPPSVSATSGTVSLPALSCSPVEYNSASSGTIGANVVEVEPFFGRRLRKTFLELTGKAL